MRIIIIDYDYPSPTNLYGNVFVHVRVKEYAVKNDCQVITLNGSKDYQYEGINVRGIRKEEDANAIIQQYKPDILFVHFALKGIIEKIIIPNKLPCVVWVHGFEALAWYRRLFNYSLGEIFTKSYAVTVRENIRQLLAFRSLVRHSNKTGQPKFVFVSNWMRHIAQADCFVTVKNFSIIPNPIDSRLFDFSEKSPELRRRVLMVRPFNSRKYATDIAINAICKLAQTPEFTQFEFTIVGKGKFFDEQTAPLVGFPNVTLINRFLPQKDIKALHETHGIYLSPTRQDAQGVSMCEAMSSGLVVITSNNTAIPEFVQHKVSGYLTNSVDEIVEYLLFLQNSPDIFLKVSKNAAESIRTRCSMENVIREEIQLANSQLDITKKYSPVVLGN